MSRVCQLFSGSKGNSILISSMNHNFLVDIGVSCKRCEEMLKSLNINPDSIEAIFITHEHIDHCKGLRVFSTKHNVPVYASPLCLDKMYQDDSINEKVDANEITEPVDFENIKVTPFKQSHDSVDCLGFRFDLADERSVSICTDTGYVTEDAKEKLMGTDLIFLESNHEIKMLENGPYPYPLKKRILSDKGHLSNFACGEFMKILAKNGTTWFVLSHLSEENNMPDVARQCAISAMSEIGLEENKDYRLYISPRENNSNGIIL